MRVILMGPGDVLPDDRELVVIVDSYSQLSGACDALARQLGMVGKVIGVVMDTEMPVPREFLVEGRKPVRICEGFSPRSRAGRAERWR